MNNNRLNTEQVEDELARLLDQVDEVLKVIDSGLFDVTADMAAIVRLRATAKEVDNRLIDAAADSAV